MKHIPTYEQFVNEGLMDRAFLAKDFKKGDQVKINSQEKIQELVGLLGVVIETEPKKGVVFVDFGKKMSGSGWATHDCDGHLDDDTGLLFQDRGWISNKIDPRFDVRNLDKI